MSDDFAEEPLPPSRRKRSREEPEEDDLDYEDEIAFPQTVKAAGVIWIVVGCLILLSVAALVAITFSFAANANTQDTAGRQAAGAVGALVCMSSVVGLFAAAFLFVGVQTVRGTARDTLGNGIGSIVFSLLEFGGAAASGSVGQFAQSGVSALSGMALLAAGVLALAGRSQYKLWRKEEVRRLKQEAADRRAERRFRK
jgi:hypothetical protein